MSPANLLVELFVEELPPKALKKLGEAFAAQLFEQLRVAGLTAAASRVTSYATPRRLAAHITAVADKAADQPVRQKLMPASVGLTADGQPTPALKKKLQAIGASEADLARLERVMDGKAETLFLDTLKAGVTLADGLQKTLHEAITKLPIPKVMTYQLHSGCALPGWDSVQFVRPAHGLVALHGADIVAVAALGLQAGRVTRGHRFEGQQEPITLADADSYASALRQQGAVIASFAERRAAIAAQLREAARAAGDGLRAIEDDALLDEVTALVELPNVLACEFDAAFLEVPPECLILTMKANQKYFPLLDAAGRLSNRFLVVSNIAPADASAIIEGNERVVRPRLSDARFFFDQDRKKTLKSRVPELAKVVYHNQLGTQGERVERLRAIARAIAERLGVAVEAAEQAAELAKADLLTGMVGEFPELQGVMGRYYALHDGLTAAVADAIEDHYKPRFAGDALPRGPVGCVVALADKLETLVGLFSIGQTPTGDKDPFALRRHALGVIRILSENDFALPLDDLLGLAAQPFASAARTLPQLSDFIYERLAGNLREQGYTAQEVDAVVSQRPQRLADIPRRLAAVRAFAALPEAAALAAANKRVGNILKKVDGDVDARVNPALFKEAAEAALQQALADVAPKAEAVFRAGDYTASLQTLAALRGPVDAFFDGVMVNADDPALRANRLALLQQLHTAMNQVADLSRLST
ncbi:MAG: glycine--tRNA ligase subunit beta [Azonexus sp.]|jgi:glycyl-tRNA synthetase beta chain|nr:glycine--tRNA ligase subunit beta [Azonexus sp.]